MVTSADVVAAFQATGSLWKAGQRTGLTGQQVQARLSDAGFPRSARPWSGEEIAELQRKVSVRSSLWHIALYLGRSFDSVVAKAASLGSAQAIPAVKIPPGRGYDKRSLSMYARMLDSQTVRSVARSRGLRVTTLCDAFALRMPDWWHQYREGRSDLEENRCAGCNRMFVPDTSQQRACSSRCSSRSRIDRDYFGGKRLSAVGLAEGVCQVCGDPDKALAAHHIVGKLNDEENNLLIAVCGGCHQLITQLGVRTRHLLNPMYWHALITLAVARGYPSGVLAGEVVDVTVEVKMREPEEGEFVE